MSHSRRKFFQLVSGGALASAAPLHLVAQQNIGAPKAAPSDRVRVALTGVNGVGFDDLCKDHGIAFYGSNGTIIANRNGWELVPEKNYAAKSSAPYKAEAVAYRGATTDDRYEHAKNFIATIKGKEKLNCDIQTGRIVALNAQIGNIAYRLGRSIKWDKINEKIVDDAEAVKLTKANITTAGSCRMCSNYKIVFKPTLNNIAVLDFSSIIVGPAEATPVKHRCYAQFNCKAANAC